MKKKDMFASILGLMILYLLISKPIEPFSGGDLLGTVNRQLNSVEILLEAPFYR